MPHRQQNLRKQFIKTGHFIRLHIVIIVIIAGKWNFLCAYKLKHGRKVSVRGMNTRIKKMGNKMSIFGFCFLLQRATL